MSQSVPSAAVTIKSIMRISTSHADVNGGAASGRDDFLVVGVGASAGGLEACRKFIGALPPGCGMAFILVQHLDPNHESMMVNLLAGQTQMTVVEATHGLMIERDSLYVIPPGTDLSIVKGALHLSQPLARHGARLPFDHLLHSLAKECGNRAVCIVLSGTGADGSLGLKSVKAQGGLVIAQDPDEAGFPGMSQSAIKTGMVDFVLPVAEIPDALARYDRRKLVSDVGAVETEQAWLSEIIDLLRVKTAHDYTHYKHGTLLRRIERRMGMAGIKASDMDRYLDFLRQNADEVEQLASDLLINVTSFFRDPKVFDVLEKSIIPDLLRTHSSDHPLRLWVAGCSTGEESYSLAMLLREQITAGTRNVKLQVFASDIDPDAIATAREGFYPETIAAEVSPGRLARFFTKEGAGYRASPELRAAVVFTVQDLLTDPPFSRLDLISCRNLMIYLRPEAQEKVMSLFKFALRPEGILLLGSSETVGNAGDGFAPISKSERLYRRIGRTQPGEIDFSSKIGDGVGIPVRAGHAQAPTRHSALADFCQRLVIEAYAPAAILINRKQECLFFMGPTDRYLRLATGAPNNDLIAVAREEVRTKLRSVIHQAWKERKRVVGDGRVTYNGSEFSFTVAALPVVKDGAELMLICFEEGQKREQKHGRESSEEDLSRVAELEQELESTRTELEGAIRNLEVSSEDQQAINEEALSINEEYQSTNEELVTSKEELQSLNEELTALNSQLQETLEMKRTTSNDLQNVLYSTDVATIFLDMNLKIRIYTPTVKLLFNIIPGDIGRPLADLNSLAADHTLLADCRMVLKTHDALEREIEANNGSWYMRRILPYRTQNDSVEGVVITFADITERKQIADTLEAANHQAQTATIAKSRFLAAASHDLRQPLQTLVLLQGLLEKTVEGEDAKKLLVRLEGTVSVMSSMLNTLLDINQIDAGAVRAEMVGFPVNDLLNRLKDEFAYHAQALGLEMRVVPCGLVIYTDPRLLEQMIRNLLNNALKYTNSGKVLLGCRRHKDALNIEIWDSGVGIPENELQSIFDEYHQLNNAARERGRGLGLGLSIVRRLSNLLGHRVGVHSHLNKGSVFFIQVKLRPMVTQTSLAPQWLGQDSDVVESVHRKGALLVIEDDREVRELLELILTDEGHRVTTASDGLAAMELVAHGTIRPDLVLADYNLPNGMDGLQVTAKLRETLYRQIPVIILTGDISTGTLREITVQNCLRLNKPVKVAELMQAIQTLLPISQSIVTPRTAKAAALVVVPPNVYVVDDDANIRDGMRKLLEDAGRTVESFASGEEFLEAYRSGGNSCLLIDAFLPGMNGFDLLQRLNEMGHRLPAIMITGYGDVPMAVQAMKAGALDFIEKPVSRNELLASVDRAIEQSHDSSKLVAWRDSAAQQIDTLTPRQHEIMNMVLAGHPSKNIAADLGISQRTVENHRASIMKKTGSKSLPALARLALFAAESSYGKP